eukprot:2319985-Pleurochrysis_carterae.AAC.1
MEPSAFAVHRSFSCAAIGNAHSIGNGEKSLLRACRVGQASGMQVACQRRRQAKEAQGRSAACSQQAQGAAFDAVARSVLTARFVRRADAAACAVSVAAIVASPESCRSSSACDAHQGRYCHTRQPQPTRATEATDMRWEQSHKTCTAERGRSGRRT